ncbi:hypothetical protein, partial [Bacillus glycinifermentans]|uniref:hypothetical protein n=1 Tax=Bacillus glycinifermentans TaxID=1664069 RepID=UPI002DB6C56C
IVWSKEVCKSVIIPPPPLVYRLKTAQFYRVHNQCYVPHNKDSIPAPFLFLIKATRRIPDI